MEEKYKITVGIIFIGSILILIANLVGLMAYIFGILLITLSGAVILYIKKMEANNDLPNNIQDYLTKYAIISFTSAIVGIVLYLIFTPDTFMSVIGGFYNFFSPNPDISNYLNLTALPFTLIALISGSIGFQKEKMPVMEVIGIILGIVFTVMLIFPLIVGIFVLVTLFFWIP